MTYGRNFTQRPVIEQAAPPRPVWQRQIEVDGCQVQDYVFWASNRDTPVQKATTNVACFPFHCGIVRPVTSGFTLPAPANCLFLGGHGQAARQSLESCVSCHVENDCLACHAQFQPHGPGFNAESMQKRAEQMCRACHGSAIPEASRRRP